MPIVAMQIHWHIHALRHFAVRIKIHTSVMGLATAFHDKPSASASNCSRVICTACASSLHAKPPLFNRLDAATGHRGESPQQLAQQGRALRGLTAQTKLGVATGQLHVNS